MKNDDVFTISLAKPQGGGSITYYLDPSRMDGMPYRIMSKFHRRLIRLYLEEILDSLNEASIKIDEEELE